MSVISRHSWVEMSWEMYICDQSPRSSSLSAPFSHLLLLFLLMTPQQLSQYSLWSCYSFSSFFSWFFSFFSSALFLLMTTTPLQRSQYSLWGRLHRGSGSMGLQSEWIGCDLAPKYGQHHSSDDDVEDEKCKFLCCRFDCVAEGNPAPSVFWTKEVTYFSLTLDRLIMIYRVFQKEW